VSLGLALAAMFTRPFRQIPLASSLDELEEMSGDSPADPSVQGQVIILAMAKQDKEKERIG
jgi:hypothetical protein